MPPFDVNGNYSPPASSFNPAISDTDISADDWNALLTDISSALTSAGTIAQASETSAAASASAAAASAASAASIGIFTTVALGIAGSVNGQFFSVIQPFGEGYDLYKNNAGAGVWVQSSAAPGSDLSQAESLARSNAVTQWPINPLHAMFSWMTASQNSRGSRGQTYSGTVAMARNLYSLPHGPRDQGLAGPTCTAFVDATTWTRLQFGGVGELFSFFTSAQRPPNDGSKWTVKAKLRSRAGAGDQAVRYGNSAAYTAATATEAGIVLSYEYTANYATIDLTGNGANTPDLEIDEVQFYNDAAANIPAFSTESPGDDFIHALAWPRRRLLDRKLDNSSDPTNVDGSGIIRFPNYPTVKVFTELTAIVCCEMVTAEANAIVLGTDVDIILGTTAATFEIIGGTDGQFAFTGTGGTLLAKYVNTGQGLQIHGVRIKNGAAAAFHFEMEHGVGTSAFAGFSARIMRVGASEALEITWDSTFNFNGNIAGVALFDKSLSDDQYYAAVAALRDRVKLAGIQIADTPAFLMAMGDSQTSSFVGARGPSWAVLQGNAGIFTPNLPMRNLAVGGTNLADAVALLPTVERLVSQTHLVTGRKAIVACYIGTNDQATIVADPAAWWATYKTTLLVPLVAMGALPVVGTLCPDGGSPPAGWEAARLALNVIIKADIYTVMDFGGDAVMGLLASCAGANYDTDHRHFSTAGHVLLQPIATTAIKTLL